MAIIPSPKPPAPIMVYQYINFNQPHLIFILLDMVRGFLYCDYINIGLSNQKSDITATVINGDKSNYPIFCKIVRYHLVMPSVPWKGLSIQDLVDGDYIRTQAIFGAPDIYRIVKAICRFNDQGHLHRQKNMTLRGSEGIRLTPICIAQFLVGATARKF
jgi:hypothetical protein